MKKFAIGAVGMAAMILCGCGDSAKPVAAPQAASASSQAQPAQDAATVTKPAAPARGEPARVGHRMQLDPVSSDKFKLGPQQAKDSGSK